jgi:hypothetical protein
MTGKHGHEDKVLNCIGSREKEKDWMFRNAAEAGLLDARRRIPSAKDMRERWWGVGDQKKTGSCVGWALADSVLRWHFVKAEWLPRDEKLSPRFIWMASKETDDFVSQPTTFIEAEGTSLKAALDIARKFGIVRDSILPFGSEKLFPGEAKTFYAIASQLKIASYFNLGLELDDWRMWLATRGPILIRVEVDDPWYNAAETQGRLDIYGKKKRKKGENIEGHAAALVGYTRTRFIVRNSWGSAWGDKGYAYASFRYAEAAFSEAYGVVL